LFDFVNGALKMKPRGEDAASTVKFFDGVLTKGKVPPQET
jgi:hypothetical protein